MQVWALCFPVNFAKFLRTPFFIEHFGWLLLHIPEISTTCLHRISHPFLRNTCPDKFHQNSEKTPLLQFYCDIIAHPQTATPIKNNFTPDVFKWILQNMLKQFFVEYVIADDFHCIRSTHWGTISISNVLCERCPNAEFFLVRIRTLFTQW